MSEQPVEQVVYDFRYGEQYSYQLLPAWDIAQAREAPGIYGWFVRVPRPETDPNRVLAYANVFFSKTFTSQIRSYLREQYSGSIERVPPLTADEITVSHLFLGASAVFCPPVYIGLSRNVHDRLKCHLAELTRAIQRAAAADVLVQEEMEVPSNDTSEESSVFGRRIAAILAQHGIWDTSCLFLKILYQTEYRRPELRAVEHFANRVFVPVCGRK